MAWRGRRRGRCAGARGASPATPAQVDLRGRRRDRRSDLVAAAVRHRRAPAADVPPGGRAAARGRPRPPTPRSSAPRYDGGPRRRGDAEPGGCGPTSRLGTATSRRGTRRRPTSARRTSTGSAQATGAAGGGQGGAAPDDARRCVDAGAAAPCGSSNHGGRQLDCAAATAVRLAGGRAEVVGARRCTSTGGVRSGRHALGRRWPLGAAGCLLRGLAAVRAGGRAGRRRGDGRDVPTGAPAPRCAGMTRAARRLRRRSRGAGRRPGEDRPLTCETRCDRGHAEPI